MAAMFTIAKQNYLETTKIFINSRMATSIGVYQYKVIL